MRKIFCFMAAAMIALCGCSEEELYDKEASSNGNLNTLYASADINASNSRINVNGFNLTWAEGDMFTLLDNDGVNVSQYLLESGAGKSTGKFKALEGGMSKQPAIALFPVLDASLLNNKLSVKLPEEYDADLSQNVPMVGSIEGNQVKFQHCMSVIKFDITNLPEGFNTIRIESSHVITGLFQIANITGSRSLTRDNTEGKTVTIKNVSNGKVFYLPLPAITISLLDIIATNGTEERTLHSIEKQSFKTGYMYTLTKDGLQQQNDFEKLMVKIRLNNTKSVSAATVAAHIGKFNASTGAFTDVNYSDRSQTNWKPLIHVERLSDWAFAYTDKKNTYYGNEDLYNKIVKGLEYWNNTTTYSTNWWYKDLKEPQVLGLLLVQLRTGKKQVPAELEKDILKNMHNTKDADPANKTGANCTDVALHWIYRGCLSENQQVLDHALTTVFKTADHTTGEGIQADNSYFQHGSQIYFGGYGDEFIKGITQIAMLTAGTSYALQGQRLDNLSNFMRNGFFLCLRGGYMPFGVLGRGVSRPNGISKLGTSKYAERMMNIDPAHRDEFKIIADRLRGGDPSYGVKPSHTHFHRADYSLHVRPNYTFDVRMVSQITARCEWGNSENLRGYYVADGSTNILVGGKEYYNIFPTWNWRRVPGTTAPQGKVIPKNPVVWGAKGISYVTGGVSDGLYGVSGMNYYDKDPLVNTGVHKSWYFFDDEVVCLGCVGSSSPDLVQTTINQRFANNKTVTVHTGTNQLVHGKTTTTYTNPKWVHHDNVGYIFPNGGKVWVRNVDQSGSWYDINQTQKKDIVKNAVFSLGIEYDLRPNQVPYAYIVLPAVNSPAEVESYVEKNNIEVVCNKYYVQSVYHKGLKIWGITFLKDGESVEYNGITVTASRFSTVLIKEIAEGQYEVWASNIARRHKNVSPLNLTFKTATGEKTIYTGLTGEGPMGGISKKFDLTL